MSNWKTRYGSNRYAATGKLLKLGDVDTLTPRQRKRTMRKENRATKRHHTRPGAKNRPTPRRGQVLAARRPAIKERRAWWAKMLFGAGPGLDTGPGRGGRTQGEGTRRAREREREVFGEDWERLVGEEARVGRGKWRAAFSGSGRRKSRS